MRMVDVNCELSRQLGLTPSRREVARSRGSIRARLERLLGIAAIWSALASLVGGLGKKAESAMIGCCTHGACGLDGALFGRGCVENADAKRMLSSVPIVGALITVPLPAACAAHDDDDAGAK